MVRLALDEEAIKILEEPQNIASIGFKAEFLKCPFWIVDNGKGYMTFTFWPVSKGVYEFHIACPKNSILQSRKLSKEVINWFFNCAGAEKITTDCPEGVISNMARKMGFKEVGYNGNNIIFEVSK